MPGYAIWIGRLLVLVGIVSYGYGLWAGSASLTALIPAVFGIVLMVLGHVAHAKEPLRKHLMHAAVLVGLLGFILPLARLVPRATELTLSAPVISQLSMALLCLVFVILGIRSFVTARRAN